MIISIPGEIKTDEHRVALPPNGVHELVAQGHTVYVEMDAGFGSGFSDAEYRAAGAHIVANASETWGKADMVIKVKEPQPEEYGFLRDNLILFT